MTFQLIKSNKCLHCIKISKMPTNLTDVEAASLPYVVSTVMTALCDVGELKENNTVSKRYSQICTVHVTQLTGVRMSFNILILKSSVVRALSHVCYT